MTTAPAAVSISGSTVVFYAKVTNSGATDVTGLGVSAVMVTPASPNPAMNCPVSTLTAGGTETCTGTYTVTQADINAGQISGVFTADATDANAGPVHSVSATATVPVTANPAIQSDTALFSPLSGATKAGQAVTVTFQVRNIGNQSLHGITVTATQTNTPNEVSDLSSVSCTKTTLGGGESTGCQAIFTPSQADMDAETDPVFQFTPTGLDPKGAAVTALAGRSVAITIPLIPVPAITLSVVATPNPANVGQVVSYALTVQNSGAVTLHNITVGQQPIFPANGGTALSATCPKTTLSAGESMTCTASYTVTTADVPIGNVTMYGTATGTAPNGALAGSGAILSRVVTAGGTALSVSKSADVPSFSAPGQALNFTITVKNIGSTTVNGIIVYDRNNVSPVGYYLVAGCKSTTLAPGASTTCTNTYYTTQADIDSGFVKDSAYALGLTPTGALYTSPITTLSVPAVQKPSIKLVKTASLAQVTATGQQYLYYFTLTNTGNTVLVNPKIHDVQAAPSDDGHLQDPYCPADLAGNYLWLPGIAFTCVGTYTVSDADISNGKITDTATATAATLLNQPVTSAPSTVTVPVAPASGLNSLVIAQTPAPGVLTYPGQQSAISFRVTNLGQTVLTNLAVTDTLTAPALAGSLSPISCPLTTLKYLDFTVCTATYTSTQADFNKGSITGTATATVTDPSGATYTTPVASTAVIGTLQTASLSLTKTANTAQVSAGQSVTYTLAVKNTGTVTETGVKVYYDTITVGTQALLGAPTCAASTLQPGEGTTCTSVYGPTTATDIANGTINNTAEMQGTTPAGGVVVSNPSTAVVATTAQNPAYTMTKTASPTQVHAAGDKIAFTYTVTNRSAAPILNTAIVDNQIAPSYNTGLGPISCPSTTVPALGQLICTATYTVTAADIANGSVSDSAYATSAVGNSNTSLAVVPVNASAIKLAVAGSPNPVVAAGQGVLFSYTVTNTGQVPLNNVAISADTLTAPARTGDLSNVSCPTTTLGAGAAMVCTATYTATQPDIDNGNITDTATVTATDPIGAALTATQSVVLPTQLTTALSIVKTAVGAPAQRAGQTLLYKFQVTNIGNDTVHTVAITDTLTSPAVGANMTPIVCPLTVLGPLQSTTCTSTYTVTQADLDNSTLLIQNTATASGLNPKNTPVTSPPYAYAVGVTPIASLTLVKTASTTAATKAGQLVTYSFLISNLGNQTLTAPAVYLDYVIPTADANNPGGVGGEGALSPVTCPATPIVPGGDVTCTGTYTVAAEDLNLGSITNYAVAHAQLPGGAYVGSNGSYALVSTVNATPSLTISKTASPTTVSAAGQTVTYSYLVTNTGNSEADTVTVADTMSAPATQTNLSAPACPNATLPAGSSETCTATYTVTQPDLDHGGITNSAVATGTDAGGNPVASTPAAATVTAAQIGALTLVKSASPTTYTTAGRQITYSFLVTNTGNVTLTKPAITETQFGGAGTAPTGVCPIALVAPGSSETCTGIYSTVQGDLDSGSVTNTATASGTDPAGNVVTSPSSTATITGSVPPVAALTLTKSANPVTYGAVGTKINYAYTATNTGNVSLTGLQVTETAFTGSGAVPAVTCPAAPLLPGATATCTATYSTTQADVDAGVIDNTATITAISATGLQTTSAPSSAEVTSTAAPALTLTKTNPPSLTVGVPSTYSLQVTNTGAATATHATISDQLPSNLAYDSAAGAACILAGQTVTCTVPGPIAAGGGTASFTITVTPLPAAAGNPAQNRATVDPTGANKPADPTTCTANGTPTGCAVTPSLTVLTPPAAPVITGPVDGAVTNDSTPPLSGTGAPGDTVTVVDETGSPVCNPAPVVNVNGDWSCTPTAALPDGPHTLTATQTDPAGNTSPASSPVHITVDTTAPTAPAITSPTSGAAVNTHTPTVTGTAEAGSTVTVFDGATVVCTTTASAGGTFSCPTSSLADGAHSLTATATDPAGNTSPASTAIPITVDTAAPAAPAITAPADGALTNSATPTVAGTGEPGAAVTVKDGAATVCTTTVTAAGTWTCPSAALTDGPHTLTATQTDPAGNTSPASSPVHITVDTTAPTAPAITSPTSGTAVNTHTPTVTGTAEAGSTVAVKDGATTICTTTADASGSWSCTPTTALGDGPHSLTATAKDPAGNTSPASTPVAITVDTAAPAAPTITSPTPGEATNDTTPTVTGTGELGSTVTVKDGATTVCTAVVTAAGTWTCTSSPLAEGAHTLTAIQADPAGNTSPTSAPVSFTVDTTAPPAPAITSPAAGADTNTTTPTVTGTGEPGDTAIVYDGATPICTTTVTAAGTFSCPITTPLTDGPHTLTVKTTDPAGNTSPASTPVTVTIDTTAPAAPTITSPTTGADTNNTKPTFTGTAEPGSRVAVKDGATTICTTTADASGNWTCTPSNPLSQGEHTIAATATDPAGNTSPASPPVTVTVDTTAPAAPAITAPAAGSTVGTATPTLAGTGEPGSTVTVKDGATTVGTATVTAAGTWTCTPSTALSEGPHSLTATATDPAGNTSPASAPVNVTVDTAIPVGPPITSPVPGAQVDNPKPPITGTGTPSDTIKIYDNNGTTPICTTTVTAAGTWTCTPTTALADGLHSLTATQTSLGGTTGPASNPVVFTVDTAAPAAPAITSPTSGADTNNTKPTFTGTAEPGSTVAVKDGATTICTTTADAFGNWTCTPTAPLSQGDHTITATATDPAGNTSPASPPITVTVDTTAPAAPVITAPAPGTDTNVNTPILAGTAEPGSTVTVKDGTTTLCTTTVDSSGNWTCTSAVLGDGPHTLTATATDPAGNTGPASAPVNLTVDTTAPAAPAITAPAPGADVNDTTPTFTGTGEPGATVTITDGTTPICTTTVLAAGTWTCTLTTPLGQGDHTIAATQTDPAGNTSPATPARALTVDTTAPAVPTITSPASGLDTNNAKPTFTGTAEPGSTVAVKDGATTICTTTADASGNWTCIPTVPLAQGDHTITATATDPAGNSSPASPPITVMVDTIPPAAPTITAPAPGSNINDATPLLAGSAEPGSTVTVKDGATTLCTAVTDASGKWSCTSAVLGDGPHTLTATAADPAGNTGPSSTPVPITVDTTAPVAPVITAPAPGADINDPTPTFTGTGQPGATLTVTDGTTPICATAVDASGNWSCTPTTPLGQGDHSIAATQTDPAGNISPATPPRTITVDTTAPAAPTISSPAAGDDINVNTPTVAGTAEPGSTVKVYDGTAVVCTTTADAAGAWTCPITTPLADGTHDLTATATDPAGNASIPSPRVQITVDTKVPTAPAITAPAPGAATNDTTPTFTGTAEPGSTVTIKDGPTTICTTTAAATGTWTCTPTTPLGQGDHTITAAATDAAGNTSPASPPRTLTVDTTAPSAPAITAPAAGTTVKDATPTFTGTGEPSAAVTITDGVTPICTTTVLADGTWTCTPTTPLGQGDHSIAATQTDPAGNTSPATPARTITVDSVPPGKPAITAPAPGADTDVNTPTAAGTAEPGSTVKVYDGTTVICTTTADAVGTWTCPITTPLADGIHKLTATATDPAGNTSVPSTPVPITVDTHAPAAPQITGPGGGGVAGARATVTGTGEAGDTVTVTDNGAVLCTTLVDASGHWSCPVTAPLADGPHTITATQTDPAGTTSPASAPTAFTVDSTPPAKPVITGPAAGSTPNGAALISGTAEPGSTITVKDGTSTVCTTVANATGTWTCYPTAPLANSTHSLTATATDPAGNTSPASNPIIFTVNNTATITAAIAGAINDVNRDGRGDLGDTVTWTITVTNTGNVALGRVTATDSYGSTVCRAAILKPGASSTCAATTPYQVTQGDVDASKAVDTATATGYTLVGADAPALRAAVAAFAPAVTVTSSGVKVTSTAVTASVPLNTVFGLAITKTGTAQDTNLDGVTDPGDTIAWSIRVRNIGTGTATKIVVSDPTAGAITCPSTTLAVGASMTCTAPLHTITSTDADAGTVVNVASAAAAGITGPVSSPTGGATIVISPTPTPVTSTPPPSPTPQLTYTGFDLAPPLLAAGLLLLLGSALVLAGRRRRTPRKTP